MHLIMQFIDFVPIVSFAVIVFIIMHAVLNRKIVDSIKLKQPKLYDVENGMGFRMVCGGFVDDNF